MSDADDSALSVPLLPRCAEAINLLLPRDFVDDPLPVTQGGILMLVQDIVGHNRLINDTIISHPAHVDVNYMIIPRPQGVRVEPQGLILRYDSRPKTSEKQLKRARDNTARKIRDGRVRGAKVQCTTIHIADLPATSTGWAGKPYHQRADLAWLQWAWEDRSIVGRMLQMDFKPIPYVEGEPTIFVDENGTAYAFRSDIVKWFNEPFPDKNSTKTLSHAIRGESLRYIDDCGPRPHEDIVANNRGDQWYNVIGTDRQNKEFPDHTQFHKKFKAQTDWLLREGGPTQKLIEIAARIFQQRFPNLAARVDNCAASLLAQGPKFAEFAIPLFRYWYNYCINGPNLQYGVDGVFTRPHVDGKNVALMMCVVFVWGDFDDNERAWLVLWEARVIIQLPVNVFLYYPSSLFTHFNCDMRDAHIITTNDGRPPTPATASPLRGVPGRGSIVFFNQASMFQQGELGSSVKNARAAGQTTTCDNEPIIAGLPSY